MPFWYRRASRSFLRRSRWFQSAANASSGTPDMRSRNNNLRHMLETKGYGHVALRLRQTATDTSPGGAVVQVTSPA